MFMVLSVCAGLFDAEKCIHMRGDKEILVSSLISLSFILFRVALRRSNLQQSFQARFISFTGLLDFVALFCGYACFFTYQYTFVSGRNILRGRRNMTDKCLGTTRPFKETKNIF